MAEKEFAPGSKPSQPSNIGDSSSQGDPPMLLEGGGGGEVHHTDGAALFGDMAPFPPFNLLYPAVAATPTTSILYPVAAAGNCSTDNVKQAAIKFKTCLLVPPSSGGATYQARRERPNGCRTVFVGGTPENFTEEIARDVFGCVTDQDVVSVRLSKKNFCHIRFGSEASVDVALVYSGYRMKIGGKNDPANTGKLHVDFAKARDDQSEYERRVQLKRRIEDDALTTTLTKRQKTFSDHEAQVLADAIKNEEEFEDCVETLTCWLERGDCSKQSSNKFYAMIQTAFHHAKRLAADRRSQDQELERVKHAHRLQLQQFLISFGNLERVFVSASRQKSWDHFSKAQRKNISGWKSHLSEIRCRYVDTAINERKEEEMDLSEGESSEAVEEEEVELIKVINKPRQQKQPVEEGTGDHRRSQRDRFISTMSIFLSAFPHGATRSSVSLYARDQLGMKDEQDVIATFQSCPTVFRQVEDGSKWKLIAFES